MQVKKLLWSDFVQKNTWSKKIYSLNGLYYIKFDIWRSANEDEFYKYECYFMGVSEGIKDSNDLDEAKSNCQKHFEEFILSNIETDSKESESNGK